MAAAPSIRRVRAPTPSSSLPPTSPGILNETVALTVALPVFCPDNPAFIVDDASGLHRHNRFGNVPLATTPGHSMKLGRVAVLLAEDRWEN
jgi:hypothetical protein